MPTPTPTPTPSPEVLLPDTNHGPTSPSATSYPLPIPCSKSAISSTPIPSVTDLSEYPLNESTQARREARRRKRTEHISNPDSERPVPKAFQRLLEAERYFFHTSAYDKTIPANEYTTYPFADNHITSQKIPKIQGLYICECCPKKPKKFDRQEDLEAHEQEKQYQCAYCNDRFKNKNETERHQNNLHLRRHSWSCAALSGYSAAFHINSEQSVESVICGYCGEVFPCSSLSETGSRIAADSDWDLRIAHLQDVHKFGECNHAKKFFRADHFRQHLKHSHSGTNGKWTYVLEEACKKDEPTPGMILRDTTTSLPESSVRVPTTPIILERIMESNLESIVDTYEKFDNTDNKTTFSKDSGYSSMVSKAQRSAPKDQEKPETLKWESESLASLQSFATMDTMSSVNPAAAGGAAEELADMLVKDNLICDLIKEGYKAFGSDRFERNLRRLLKTFAFSLRREARNDLEKSAIRIVHNYRAYVIRLIGKRLKLAEDKHASSMDSLHTQKRSQIALRRFLEHLPGTEEISTGEPVQENELGSDFDSDLSNNEHPYIPTLENVKLYLLSSTAYRELKQQLNDFVRQSDAPSPLKRRKLPVFELEFEPEDTINVGEKTPVADGVLNAVLNYPHFGSSSIGEVEFAWNSTFETLPPYEELRCLQAYDNTNLGNPCLQELTNRKYFANTGKDKDQPLKSQEEETHLEDREPKHEPLEECLLSMGTWISKVPHRLSHLSLKFNNWWAKARRKPVGNGCSRVEWTCACGHGLFADFGPKSHSSLAKFAALIKTKPNRDQQSQTSQPLTETLKIPPTAYLQPTALSDTSSQIGYGFKKRKVAKASFQRPSPTSRETKISFLELCVNTGPHLKTLAEIDVANISTDGALFQSLRKQYLRLRGFRSKFWLLKPSSVSFVRFSLENRHRVGILQKPLSLPPKSLVDAKQWIYNPCPLEGDPPIASDLFLHYLQCKEGSPSLFWLLRFPRKLETSLLNSSCDTSAIFGWGIHIDEGPDFAALFRANFLVLVMSGVAAGFWKFFENDFQGAFGFACWILAVLNCLLVAYMFKWRQE